MATYKSSPYMQLFFNVLVFNIWLISDSQKEKRQKNEGGRAIGTLNHPEIISGGEGGACKNAEVEQLWPSTSSPAPMWSVAISGSEHRSLTFGVHGPFCLPQLHKLCVSNSRNTGIAAYHVAGGVEWVAATVLRTKIDQNLQFTIQVFPCNFQAFNRL